MPFTTKTIKEQSEIKLVGIKARTNNKNEFNPETAKICATLTKYHSESITGKIENRVSPGKTYCVYTEYESDNNGDYTYFVGEEISSIDTIPEGLDLVVIPAQEYSIFTSLAGTMPKVCIDLWMSIWGMKSEDFGGDRAYIADFEIYDERAGDHSNTILDVYIGIK